MGTSATSVRGCGLNAVTGLGLLRKKDTLEQLTEFLHQAKKIYSNKNNFMNKVFLSNPCTCEHRKNQYCDCSHDFDYNFNHNLNENKQSNCYFIRCNKCQGFYCENTHPSSLGCFSVLIAPVVILIIFLCVTLWT